MPARHANWYNLHNSRSYPLDDRATSTTDNGQRLPTDLIVDCQLRFPNTAGRYAFVSGITISPALVSVVFLAADDIDATGGFKPLATYTAARSAVTPGVPQAVTPLLAGVGGVIVFDDVSEAFVGRFSTPRQSLLCPRIARGYEPLPVTTLGKAGRDEALTGVIELRGGGDIEVLVEPRNIPTVGLVDAVVVRLRESGGTGVLARYIGPCGARPESNNCARPGLQGINEAIPDCNGNLNIVFQGLERYPYADCGGETVEHDVPLSEVCSAIATPNRFVGRDLCAPSETSASSASATEPASLSSASSAGSSASLSYASLPYCANFDDAVAAYFVELSGSWGFAAVDSPEEPCGSGSTERSYAALDPSQRSVSVWDGGAYATSLGRVVTTDVQLVSGGPKHNGGIVINYHTVGGPANPRVEYYMALLDQDVGELQLWQSFGVSPPIKVNAVSLARAPQADHWYRLTATSSLVGDKVNIQLTVSGVTQPSWVGATLNTLSARFLPANGLYGLGASYSYARFAFFQVS